MEPTSYPLIKIKRGPPTKAERLAKFKLTIQLSLVFMMNRQASKRVEQIDTTPLEPDFRDTKLNRIVSEQFPGKHSAPLGYPSNSFSLKTIDDRLILSDMTEAKCILTQAAVSKPNLFLYSTTHPHEK
jgi:hypothetical protein